MTTITQSLLKELFDYDPDVGVFVRKVQKGPSIRGTIAGSVNSKGYGQICINGKRYVSHRLAWIYVYGTPPSGELDHINRDKSDNRIANLREVTRHQNCQNVGATSSNSSGFKGVSWEKTSSKWRARIRVNGVPLSLGCFDSKEAAAEAYRAAAMQYHPCAVFKEAA